MPVYWRVCLAFVLLAAFAPLMAAPIGASVDEQAALQRLRQNAPEPLWIRAGHLTPQARQLLEQMRRAAEYGLEAADFAPLSASLDAAAADPRDAAEADMALSLAALRLITYLHDGRVDPLAAGYELSRRRAPIDRDALLMALVDSPDVAAFLAALEPRSSQYRQLKRVLAHYREIPDRFVPQKPAGPGPLRTGQYYAGAPALRRRLQELGDAAGFADPEPAAAGIYDVELAAQVRSFQRRHGLRPDGALGPRTLAALAVPMSFRARQIELTMERWRWLPDLRAPAVIVNVPQFVLFVLPDPGDATARMLEIPVIVGKEVRQTPVFDSAIDAVVIRPYWDVPRSITRDELLPLIARDPAYLERHDMEIVQGEGARLQVLSGAAAVAQLRAGRARLRQRPGPGNALGLIKFVLPSRHDVYLHSTPEALLFGREQRALSHGCIRVSDTTALAAYLLQHTPGDWSTDAIEAATSGSVTFTVRLAQPVPVYILYGTVVMNSEGQAQFFDDIYGYDRRLDALLSHADSPQS